MAEISLNAVKREPSTKGTLNQLRKDGYVPGVFYIKGQDPISFTTEAINLNQLVYTSENHIINLIVDGAEPLLSILKDVQFDPVSEDIVHIDLLGLTKGQEITIQVPILLSGRAEGVKAGGQLNSHLHKVEVRCLPRHIPEHLEIDVTPLNVGQSINVRDLEFENLTITTSGDLSVVSVGRARGMEDDDIAAADEDVESAEPEVISKGSSEEE